MSAIRFLIVDDEPLAVERLQLLLARIDGVALAGTASEGAAALRLIEALTPDVVLLDIAMPGMDGIEVARALGSLEKPPMVIFVTAFDTFAVAAFEVEAIDYLMKPVSGERLAKAVDRARGRLSEDDAGEPAPKTSRHLEEFWVSEPRGLVRLAAADVDRITAERDYMRLHVGRRSWLINHTIARLEEELDPTRFVRLHRSSIVRRDFVTGFRRDETGRWYAQLGDGEEQKVGRLYLQNARELAGRA
ncbi:LytTR family DNA-binding domain-containing protein [Sphingosinicella sp. BN140058]|uniref:LytR/AlgR family response regulator transcription factor n=1 Tax=Sphingosinicella sp. BN140058 TaxID=1892855 RepID=UPI001012D2D5|nr:LytTR family DNA-binding domain-containing protein [Sphingosinicella sp. BN140058]QAY78462.1 response regulator transcription factor [Sphingosinicella sp. BN140058]